MLGQNYEAVISNEAITSQMRDINHNIQMIVDRLNGNALTPIADVLATPLPTDQYGMFTPVGHPLLTPQPHVLDIFKTTKLDFPIFKGDNMRQWIPKVGRYF